MDEVEEGEAYFLTVLDGHTLTKCSINITKLKKQNEPSIKGLLLRLQMKKFFL